MSNQERECDVDKDRPFPLSVIGFISVLRLRFWFLCRVFQNLLPCFGSFPSQFWFAVVFLVFLLVFPNVLFHSSFCRVFSFVVSRYRFCRHVSELAVPFPNLIVVVPNELLRFRYFLLRFRTLLCFVSTFAVVFWKRFQKCTVRFRSSFLSSSLWYRCRVSELARPFFFWFRCCATELDVAFLGFAAEFLNSPSYLSHPHCCVSKFADVFDFLFCVHLFYLLLPYFWAGESFRTYARPY